MNKECIFLIMAVLLASCGTSTVDRANNLAKGDNLDIGEITYLDSILDFPESYEYVIKAADLRFDADSILKARIEMLEEMKSNGMLEEMEKLAIQTKDRVTSLIKTAMEYDNMASLIRLKNEVKGSEKKFMGYRFISDNDSCKYTVYFNSDVSKIVCIDKTSR